LLALPLQTLGHVNTALQVAINQATQVN